MRREIQEMEEVECVTEDVAAVGGRRTSVTTPSCLASVTLHIKKAFLRQVSYTYVILQIFKLDLTVTTHIFLKRHGEPDTQSASPSAIRSKARQEESAGKGKGASERLQRKGAYKFKMRKFLLNLSSFV